jgi:hypothetical protein
VTQRRAQWSGVQKEQGMRDVLFWLLCYSAALHLLLCYSASDSATHSSLFRCLGQVSAVQLFSAMYTKSSVQLGG